MWEVGFFIGGYGIQACASGLLCHQLRSTKSVYGLSAHTQVLFLMSTVSRCIWVTETRLTDSPLAFGELAISVGLQILNLYYFYRFRGSQVLRKDKDTTNVFWGFQWYYLAAVAGLAACAFHPGRSVLSMQIMVAFSIYSEALALLPQLSTMRNCIEVESMTSHYVAMLVASRFLRLLFWVQLYRMGETFPGLMLADLFHTVLSGDFLHLWFKKLRHGGMLLYR